MIFNHLTGRAITDDHGRLLLNTDEPVFGFNPPPPELEFVASAHRCDDIEAATDIAAMVKNAFDDGWMTDEKIICPPFVIIIFCREKQHKENAEDATS